MRWTNSAWLLPLVLSATIGCQSSADDQEPIGEPTGEETTATGGSEAGSEASSSGNASGSSGPGDATGSNTGDSGSSASTAESGSTSGSGGASSGSDSMGGSDSTGSSDSSDSGSAGGTGGASDSNSDADASTTSSTALPYANVVAVAASGDPGSFTFDVSIESADIDCSQYADWWEVLSEDGTLIYRRILTHSHTDENGTSDPDAPGNTFTRDGGPIEIAADQVVIVRAHMSNSDVYIGMVMRGSVADGFSEAPELGADFAADVEDDPPQPESCLF